MSNGIKITVVGNLVADPELRYTQSGLAVANFTIASSERVFDRNANEWKDGDTVFMRSSVWRQLAENLAASATKGMQVIATGTLKQREYETKEGEKRTSFELDVDTIGVSLARGTATFTKSDSRVADAGNASPVAAQSDAPVSGGQAPRVQAQSAPAQPVAAGVASDDVF